LRIACIGECMIELSDAADGVTRRYGGDTLNTAVYASRLGKRHAVSVDYFTALGDDPYSDEMITGWRNEGVGVDHVRRLPGRVPGLYMIKTGQAGERSFYYWRDMAPAKSLFDGLFGQALVTTLAGYDWIYFSGITLGILNIEGRLALLEALRRASQNNASIVYDSNYRPRLWEDVDEAIAVNEVALRFTDIAMPSFDDERILYGDANAKATAQRIGNAGVPEIVVKNAANDILLQLGDNQSEIAACQHPSPLDTTAAGDSFNAAYIVARALGQSPEYAVNAGASLAYDVVGVRGALLPLDQKV
jgi:2-dehydro-3-deoxygluconokinase